MAAASSLIFER